jgi:putative sterol carrier protein
LELVYANAKDKSALRRVWRQKNLLLASLQEKRSMEKLQGEIPVKEIPKSESGTTVIKTLSTKMISAPSTLLWMSLDIMGRIFHGVMETVAAKLTRSRSISAQTNAK